MARSKAPLSERDANTTPQQTTAAKKGSEAGAKSSASNQLIDVANTITKTYGKKRSHENDDDGNGGERPEDAAKPSPKAKKQKTAKEATKDDGDDKSKKAAPKPKPKSKDDDSDPYDFSNITLDGESNGKVPIFDTCDDIRNKINAHLRTPKATIAGLGRMFAKVANYDSLQGKQISDFLRKKGPRHGATSRVYYAGYVFFEKLRLKQGKPKSKKRVEMEQVHPATGCDTEHDASTGFWCGPDERPSEDKYGIVTFHPTTTMSRGGFKKRKA